MKVDNHIIYFFSLYAPTLFFSFQSENEHTTHSRFSTLIFHLQALILHKMYHSDY